MLKEASSQRRATLTGAEVGSWAEARAARERTRVVVEAFMIHLGIAHESDRKKKVKKARSGRKEEERRRVAFTRSSLDGQSGSFFGGLTTPDLTYTHKREI